jgi:hypothetical protein
MPEVFSEVPIPPLHEEHEDSEWLRTVAWAPHLDLRLPLPLVSGEERYE